MARIGVFAALFVATSFIPISIFIGAPSFLALNLVVTPVIAIILSPFDAFLASLFGGVLSFYAVPSQAMFGPYTILLPICGSTLGSLAYHRRRLGALIASLFLLGSISAYLIVNYPFPFFVAPHLAAALLAIFSLSKLMSRDRVRIPVFAFIATMSEQGMMMIFAVYLLGLPWEAFVGIMPLMVYERIIGIFGASLVIFGLNRALPSNLNIVSWESKGKK
jgi:hypothetical protein